MNPLRRNGANKGKHARNFRSKTTRTKGANIQGLQRGGWRL